MRPTAAQLREMRRIRSIHTHDPDADFQDLDWQDNGTIRWTIADEHRQRACQEKALKFGKAA